MAFWRMDEQYRMDCERVYNHSSGIDRDLGRQNPDSNFSTVSGFGAVNCLSGCHDGLIVCGWVAHRSTVVSPSSGSGFHPTLPPPTAGTVGMPKGFVSSSAGGHSNVLGLYRENIGALTYRPLGRLTGAMLPGKATVMAALPHSEQLLVGSVTGMVCLFD